MIYNLKGLAAVYTDVVVPGILSLRVDDGV